MSDRTLTPQLADMIRAAWFVLAMVPVVAISGALALFALVLCVPLILYSAIIGRHLKDPRNRGLESSGE